MRILDEITRTEVLTEIIISGYITGWDQTKDIINEINIIFDKQMDFLKVRTARNNFVKYIRSYYMTTNDEKIIEFIINNLTNDYAKLSYFKRISIAILERSQKDKFITVLEKIMNSFEINELKIIANIYLISIINDPLESKKLILKCLNLIKEDAKSFYLAEDLIATTLEVDPNLADYVIKECSSCKEFHHEMFAYRVMEKVFLYGQMTRFKLENIIDAFRMNILIKYSITNEFNLELFTNTKHLLDVVDFYKYKQSFPIVSDEYTKKLSTLIPKSLLFSHNSSIDKVIKWFAFHNNFKVALQLLNDHLSISNDPEDTLSKIVDKFVLSKDKFNKEISHDIFAISHKLSQSSSSEIISLQKDILLSIVKSLSLSNVSSVTRLINDINNSNLKDILIETFFRETVKKNNFERSSFAMKYIEELLEIISNDRLKIEMYIKFANLFHYDNKNTYKKYLDKASGFVSCLEDIAIIVEQLKKVDYGKYQKGMGILLKRFIEEKEIFQIIDCSEKIKVWNKSLASESMLLARDIMINTNEFIYFPYFIQASIDLDFSFSVESFHYLTDIPSDKKGECIKIIIEFLANKPLKEIPDYFRKLNTSNFEGSTKENIILSVIKKMSVKRALEYKIFTQDFKDSDYVLDSKLFFSKIYKMTDPLISRNLLKEALEILKFITSNNSIVAYLSNIAEEYYSFDPSYAVALFEKAINKSLNESFSINFMFSIKKIVKKFNKLNIEHIKYLSNLILKAIDTYDFKNDFFSTKLHRYQCILYIAIALDNYDKNLAEKLFDQTLQKALEDKIHESFGITNYGGISSEISTCEISLERKKYYLNKSISFIEHNLHKKDKSEAFKSFCFELYSLFPSQEYIEKRHGIYEYSLESDFKEEVLRIAKLCPSSVTKAFLRLSLSDKLKEQTSKEYLFKAYNTAKFYKQETESFFYTIIKTLSTKCTKEELLTILLENIEIKDFNSIFEPFFENKILYKQIKKNTSELTKSVENIKKIFSLSSAKNELFNDLK